MAHKTLEQSYKQIKEQSRYTWRVMSSLSIQCVSAASFSVVAITKFFSSIAALPFAEGSQGTELKKARMSIADSQFTSILAKQKVYNWTRCTKPVIALVVPGDGNSLCHAVSVHICGLTDQVLFFRRCLKNTCDKQADTSSPLFLRWKHYTAQQCEQLGKTWTEESLERGWSNICRNAFTTPVEARSQRNSQSIYSTLSQFHIFVMAQITRRSIIVVGLEDNDFRPSIYLPIMIPVEECVRCPIYLAYNKGHFAPLVVVDETSTDTRFRDLCIPITDKNFKQFEFPYLFENEDGMSLLKSYVTKTDVVYTTEHEILEVPAVRFPERKSSPDDFVINPNKFFEICFNRLSEGGGPADVFNLWKYLLELQSQFEDELPVGFTFDYPIQPLSSSYQPESEAEDDADDRSTNFRTSAISSRPSENSRNTVRTRDQETFQGLQSESDHSLEGDTIASKVLLNTEDTYRAASTVQISGESGYESGNVPQPPREHHSRNTASEQSISHLFTGPPSEHSLESNAVSEATPHEDIENDWGESGMEEDIYSSASIPVMEQIENDSLNRENVYSRSLSSGVTVQCKSNSHVKVLNCGNISFTVLKLTSRDNVKQVSVILEKRGLKDNDKVELRFEPDPQLDVQYTHTIRDVLDMNLKKLQENVYRLHILLPNTVLCGIPAPEPDLPEAMNPVNESSESSYVDIEDHPNKCRTAGCNGRAVRQYRYLCSSCHQSWREMLNRNAESSASFSYIDSVVSVDAPANDGLCAITGCTNQGEDRYYGFCETCFHTPAI